VFGVRITRVELKAISPNFIVFSVTWAYRAQMSLRNSCITKV